LAKALATFENSLTPASATPNNYMAEQMDNAQQELERLIATFESNSLTPDADLRRLLEKHLLAYFPPVPLRTQSLEWFNQAPPPLQSLVYWSELDCITAHVRRWVFNILQARIRSIFKYLEDAITCAMHVRQLLELGIWAIYYQYGCTVGMNMLQRIVKQHGSCIYLFPSLENFVRGAVAPEPDRLQLVLELAGGGLMHPDISQSVGEISASLAKQGAIVRFISEEHDRRSGTHLSEHCETADRVYYLCCGLIHPTPLLTQLSAELGENPEQIRQAMKMGALRAIRSILHLLDTWYFNPTFVKVRFAPIVLSRFPGPKEARVLRVESEILDKLKHRDDKVLISFQDGSNMNLYSGRRRSRP
jgi:hypothetical protein